VYELAFSRIAARSLRRMPTQDARTVRARLDQLAVDPRAPHLDVRRLAGREGYRLRVGDWRVLYDLDDRLRVIDVLDVRQRKEAYR